MFFFFVALRWAPRPFGGARAKKKNTTQGVFFLLRPRGKAREGEKKNTTQGVFFCCGPGERQGKEKPRWKPARGQSKKKNTNQGVFFFAPAPKKGRGRRSPVGRRHGARAKKKRLFALAPCRRPTGLLLPLPFFGAGAKKKHPGWCFFFFLWPRAGFQRGFSFPCLSPGPQQKKNTLGGVFFFCSGPVPASNGASPSLAFRRGRSKKKKNPGWCCFFCCGPARTLTHSLRAWVAMPPPRRGGVFFFAAAPPGPGWCFFFAVAPPGRSLTHGGLGRFRQGPGGGFFFLLRPRRVFLDNSKKCLGYYIGSKKTRRGHSKKKNTTSTHSFQL